MMPHRIIMSAEHYRRPSAPSISATAGDTLVGLTITLPGQGETQMRIYRDTSAITGNPADNTGLIIDTVAAAASYQDTGLTNGTTYFYRVTVLSATGQESAFSNEASAAPSSSVPATGTEIMVLEADQITGLADGDQVNTWPDSSGNANDMVLLGGSPKWRQSSGPNSQPYVDFPTTNDDMWMNLGNGNEISQPHVIIAVVIDKTATTATRYIIDGATISERCALLISGGNWNMYAGTLLSVGAGASLLSSWSLMRMTFNGASSAFHKNGISQASGNAGTNICQGITLNAAHGGVTNGTSGYAALVWLDSPTAQDISDWEDYLTTKYGAF